MTLEIVLISRIAHHGHGDGEVASELVVGVLARGADRVLVDPDLVDEVSLVIFRVNFAVVDPKVGLEVLLNQFEPALPVVSGRAFYLKKI